VGDEELRALGTVLVLEGSSDAFPLKIDSLESWSKHKHRRPRWMLLSVTPSSGARPEQAMVWVSDQYRAEFLKLFEDFLLESTTGGQPKNRELVANIATIRSAVLKDLWQSFEAPPERGQHWWELWLRPTDDSLTLVRAYAEVAGLSVGRRTLRLQDRTVVWVRGAWDSLQGLPFTSVPLAEIRRPEFTDTLEDLPADDQAELAEDLATRIHPAPSAAPAVCHLDTGVRRSHVLLSDSLAAADHHSIVGALGDDRQNHGTLMAGLALFGDLDPVLLGSSKITLGHRLESVKVLPDSGPGHDPLTYGVVTAQAVAVPEATFPRSRVFCMPITAPGDAAPGEPTLWSASIDALAMGVDIGRDGDTVELISDPDPDAARLFVVSAGNVHPNDHSTEYRDVCDLSAIEDPAQAWNALTVGAHTDLTALPTDPTFDGWSAVADGGDISPHSRTSVRFARRTWPIKPDICMEGGNLLHNGAGDFHSSHPLMTVRTTDAGGDLRIGSAHATSAATAQAARLAALVMASYPNYWPETVRGLVVHAAQWTPAMRAEITGAGNKTARHSLLRRYGWGVPTESAVLGSTRQSVTMVSQDSFVPFLGHEHAARRFRLHRLPWPSDVLRNLGGANVALRVTLSYFIEPTASRRGWRRRYTYPSHGLRFELKAPLESVDNFVDRVNQTAEDEEQGHTRPSGQTDRWLVGPNQRNLGSLHQDVWEGTGPDLADCGLLAVYPTGGWWKSNRRSDRENRAVRYALIVSLATPDQDVDLYTPIVHELTIPLESIVTA